ncbi:5765_t:CDS:2 [Cetraspora pellucida]|uniref:5765_t:CDS:1 n=1 Tax=Cetraspora pellucida TaxID=1433469 RepID=A0A9N9G8A0_9GLOM|nr:5765_t:CDS:2 [Cetraspora pellucida]
MQDSTHQSINYYSRFTPEIQIRIFVNIRHPKNLLMANKAWYKISKQTDVRAEWVIVQFSKAHALFHSIRLGPKFVNVDLIKKVIEMGGILSRYFVQRFLLSFGSYDPKLIEMKIEHNVGNIDREQIRRVQQKSAAPWGSDTPLDVFTYILLEASMRLNPSDKSIPYTDFAVKGNDMESFHFQSGGPYAINQANMKLKENLDSIKHLITGYKMPDVQKITEDLQSLLDLGFKPTNTVILDILQLFENRLEIIGERIICSFISVRKNENLYDFYKMLVVEAIKPDRNLKKIEVLNFLEKTFRDESGKIFISAMGLIEENSSIDKIKDSNHVNNTNHVNNINNNNINNQYEQNSQPENNDHNSVKFSVPYKPLLYNLIFYNWILIKFPETLSIAQLAFNDIIETRISLELNQNSSKSFEIKYIETCNIFKLYCNFKNFFLISHLELLKKISNEDILCPLFEFYLPDLFGLPTTFNMPMEITDDSNIYFKPKKRKKRTILKNEKVKWLTAIKEIHDDIVNEGNSIVMTDEFRDCIEDLYYKLEEEGKFKKVEIRSETPINNNTKKYKAEKNQKKKDFYDKDLYIHNLYDFET